MDDLKALIPSQKELYIPILRVLSDGKTRSVDSIVSELLPSMGLGPSVLNVESNVRNKSELKSRVEWALTFLKKKGLVSMPEQRIRRITQDGLRILSTGENPEDLPDVPAKQSDDARDATSDQLEGVSGDTSDIGGRSFFDYLTEKGLAFPTEVVEDFLLSLKAKQFLILSGGTGTGKTKLAQAYGEYVSRRRGTRVVETEVTLGESARNKGFTIRRDDFLGTIPEAGRADGAYGFELGDCHGTGEIQMTPRFWFRKDGHIEEIQRTIEKLKGSGDKATLRLFPPGSAGDGYAIVPVGPNWTDGRHIVGYRNAITGRYVSTASLELMLRAGRDPGNPYLLILDEMNLSHVERYLSDVISCMESGEPIPMDSDGEDVPRALDLGDNLFVIGTVNMDETTYAFSPKVLDRANVMEFAPASVRSFLQGGRPAYEPSGDVGFLQDCMRGLECRSMSSREIMSEIAGADAGIAERITDDLDGIQKIMSAMRLPFGYRTLDEVSRFLYVARIYDGGAWADRWVGRMDTQILQKILPKIHGNSSVLEPLRDLGLLCEKGGYARSAEKLARMVAILESQRYVSFNC